MKKTLITFALIGSLLAGSLLVMIFTKPADDPAQSSVEQRNVSAPSRSVTLDPQSVTIDTQECLDSLFVSKAMQLAPEETLNKINLLPDNSNKEICYEAALLAWSDIDANALNSWTTFIVPQASLDMALASLTEKYSLDPSHSVIFAEKIFDDALGDQLFIKLMPTWGRTAPKNALSWAVKQKIEKSIKWIELIVNAAVLNDIGAAIASLTALSDSHRDQLTAAVQAIINHFDPVLVNTNILAVIAWLEPEWLRAELIGALLPLMLASDNIGLSDIDYLISSLEPGEIRDELYQNLAMNWVFLNPNEAAEYAESLEVGTRELAISAVVSSWMHEDLAATDAWLDTVSGNIDLAADTLGRGSSEIGNIEMSDKWVDIIDSKELRTSAAIDIVNERYERDPGMGIYHLVFQKNISDQDKLTILHKIYPGEVFVTPMQALDELGRLENLNSPF